MANPVTFDQLEAVMRAAISPAIEAQFETQTSVFNSFKKKMKENDAHPWLTSLEAYANMIEGRILIPHPISSTKGLCVECQLASLRQRRSRLQTNEKFAIAHYQPGVYQGELAYVEGKIRELCENRFEGDSLTGYEIKSRGFRIPFY